MLILNFNRSTTLHRHFHLYVCLFLRKWKHFMFKNMHQLLRHFLLEQRGLLIWWLWLAHCFRHYDWTSVTLSCHDTPVLNPISTQPPLNYRVQIVNHILRRYDVHVITGKYVELSRCWCLKNPTKIKTRGIQPVNLHSWHLFRLKIHLLDHFIFNINLLKHILQNILIWIY